jgi:hypothetical protein
MKPQTKPSAPHGAYQHRAGVPDKRRRFQRAEGVTRDLTPDDLDLFQLLDQVRLADSRQLKLYLAPNGNHRAFLRRLQTLYHAGYLDRPKNQLGRRFLDNAGARFYVYALAERGARKLLSLEGAGRADVLTTLTRNNERIQARAIDHRIAVTESVLTFAAAADQLGATLDHYEGEALTAAFPKLPTRVTITDGEHRHKVPLYPDTLFVLTPNNQRSRFFFLEADRGTEPVRAGDWQRTSIRRKLVAYATLYLDAADQAAGITAFRVLTITTTTDRRDTMRSLARELHPPKVRGLFLFTTADQVTLDNPTAALTQPVWYEPRDESAPVALLA